MSDGIETSCSAPLPLIALTTYSYLVVFFSKFFFSLVIDAPILLTRPDRRFLRHLSSSCCYLYLPPRLIQSASYRQNSISSLSAGLGSDVLDCWAIRFPLGAPPFDPAISIRSLSYTLSAVSRSRAETQNRHPRLRASLFYLYASHNSDRLSEYTPPQGYFFFFPFLFFGVHHSSSKSARGLSVYACSHSSRLRPHVLSYGNPR